jgi:hypothetical protein
VRMLICIKISLSRLSFNEVKDLELPPIICVRYRMHAFTGDNTFFLLYFVIFQKHVRVVFLNSNSTQF